MKHFLVKTGDEESIWLTKNVCVAGMFGLGEVEGTDEIEVTMDDLDAVELIKNYCNNCECNFYTHTDEAVHCPFCGSRKLDKS